MPNSQVCTPVTLFFFFLDRDATQQHMLKGSFKIFSRRYPRKRNRLIELPEDYTALLNQASHFQ